MKHEEVWPHWEAMVSASRSVLGSSEDAYDCAAEAMAQVLERAPQDVVNAEAFLVTVARRRAIDHYRRGQRERRRDAQLAAYEQTSVVDIAEDVARRAEAAWAAGKA